MLSQDANYNQWRVYRVPLIFLCFLFLLSPADTLAQKSSQQLKADRKKLEREIQTYIKLLSETRQTREKSLNELHLINKQVYLREQLLNGIQRELKQIDREIEITGKTILSLEEDLTKLQEQFARLAVAAYKSTMKTPKTFYILSSKSVSEGYNRMKYFREFKKAQEAQVKFIRRTKAFLDYKKRDLEEKKVDKTEVLKVQRVEKEKLAALKEEQKELYNQLKEKEEQYAQTLEKKKKELIALNEKIQERIREEIARKEAMATQEEKDRILPLTNSFKENKGKFPWPLPTPNGVITTKFGRQKLGTSNVEVNVNGIDITTTEGQPIRAVFEGEVLDVMTVPGFGKMVILGHGNYYTVYAHLGATSVEKGQKIAMLEEVGVAKTDTRTGETKVHFQVFYNKTPMNPEEWIVSKK